MILVLLGSPGSGKGTQALLLAKKLNIPQLSTGDMLRAAIAQKTEIGLLAKSLIDKGNFMPNEVTVKLMKDRMCETDCQNGFILDGFPRNVPQAEAFKELFTELNLKVDHYLYFDIKKEILIERISGRRTCPGCNSMFHERILPPKIKDVCDNCGKSLIQRPDDRAEIIQQRFDNYDQLTSPLIEQYQKTVNLKKVDAMLSPEEVLSQILKIIGG